MSVRKIVTSVVPAVALALTGCDRKPETAAPAPVAADASPLVPAPQEPGSQFNPLLRSEALKDAIHRAMMTGENQRWQGGKLSG